MLARVFNNTVRRVERKRVLWTGGQRRNIDFTRHAVNRRLVGGTKKKKLADLTALKFSSLLHCPPAASRRSLYRGMWRAPPTHRCPLTCSVRQKQSARPVAIERCDWPSVFLNVYPVAVPFFYHAFLAFLQPPKSTKRIPGRPGPDGLTLSDTFSGRPHRRTQPSANSSTPGDSLSPIITQLHRSRSILL